MHTHVPSAVLPITGLDTTAFSKGRDHSFSPLCVLCAARNDFLWLWCVCVYEWVDGSVDKGNERRCDTHMYVYMYRRIHNTRTHFFFPCRGTTRVLPSALRAGAAEKAGPLALVTRHIT